MAGLSNTDVVTLVAQHQQDRHHLLILVDEQRRTNELLTVLIEALGQDVPIPPPPAPARVNWRGKVKDR